MGVWQGSSSSSDYFKTPPRRHVSLWTGELYDPPIDGRIGGDPCRMETDAEYALRLEREGLK